MNEHPIKSVMAAALEGLKGIADVNTVIGEAVETVNGTVIIPVSKVSLGLIIGGSDFEGAGLTDDKDNLFGGGAGGGVTIEPVAFLVVTKDDIKMMSVDSESAMNMRVLDLIPKAIDVASELFNKKKKIKIEDVLNEE